MHDRERWVRLLADAADEPAAQAQRICALCVEMLGVTGAGVSMVTIGGHRGVVCATDDVSARIEDLQLTLGEGPCIDAVTSGTAVLVPDLFNAEDVSVEHWPAFMDGALAAGVRAVFVFPLRIGAISLGALDLYRDEPGTLTAGDLSAAFLAADAAALALLRVGGQGASFADDDAMRSSYQFHVHQATGMVQVQLGATTEEAFLTLRARAFGDGRSLADVATDVVARRLRFSTEDT